MGAYPCRGRSRRRRRPPGRLLPLVALAITVGSAEGAQARPGAPSIVCQEQASIPECAGKVVTCGFCHETVDPPAWNPYGSDLREAIEPGGAFEDGLAAALRAIEREDSDGDGVSNVDEMKAGTAPGDAESVVRPSSSMDAGSRCSAERSYDAQVAYRRVSTLYCGHSPSYDEMRTFKETARNAKAARTAIHAALDRCLGSDYWQKDALPRLADKRIRPQASLGPDTQIRLGGALRVVLGDYYYDYRLWRFIMSNDRDMRELITADYHVVEGSDGKLSQTREVIPKPDPTALGGGQPLLPQYRAGMITTQWFLHLNTMLSALPRVTAAQAYRAYLGADIAAMEGLVPVPGEPVDIDHKGVDQPKCANCHSTLDPLSYAFAKYEGSPSPMRPAMSGADGGVPRLPSFDGGVPRVPGALDGGFAGISGLDGGRPTGSIPGYDILGNIGGFNANRPLERIPGWDDEKQRPYVLGKPVKDLVELVRVAAESDPFKRNLALIFFTHALGAEPSLAQQTEFNALWRSLPEDGYSANRLIHRLVDTNSFGAP